MLIPKGRNRKDKISNRFKVSLKLNRQITLNPILLGSMSHLTDPHILDTLRQELVTQISSHPICTVLLSGGAHSATPSSWNCTLLHTGTSWLGRWPHCHSLLKTLWLALLLQQPCIWLQPHGSRLLYPSKSRWEQSKCWCLLDAAKAALWPTEMVQNVDWSSKCEVAQQQHLLPNRPLKSLLEMMRQS